MRRTLLGMGIGSILTLMIVFLAMPVFAQTPPPSPAPNQDEIQCPHLGGSVDLSQMPCHNGSAGAQGGTQAPGHHGGMMGSGTAGSGMMGGNWSGGGMMGLR